MESMANNLTYWNARLEAALEIIRAAAERSRAVAEACDIIEEALYYIRESAEPIPRARQSDGSDGSDKSDTEQDTAAGRPVPLSDRSDGSDKSDTSPAPCAPAQCAPPAAPEAREAVRPTADQSPAGATRICADTLENDFVLGEVETVQEAVEMAVATFGRDAVAEYCGVRPQEIAKAEQGYRVQKVDAAIRPLLPNYHPEGEEE